MSKELNENIPNHLKQILHYTMETNLPYRDLYHKTAQHWFLFHLFQALHAQYASFNIHQVAETTDVDMPNGIQFKAGYLETEDNKLIGFKYTLCSAVFLEGGDGKILAERIASEFCAYVTHLFSDTDKLSAVSRDLVGGELTIHVTWLTPWERSLTNGDKA